ncbi:MAG TPA: cold shock domain-containing protein [Chryseolinea sp.]|nr:cold shock domain-containing protein [Chryseolinea sp.]
MAKSQTSISKKEIENKKLRKRKEKEERREERKANAKDGKSLDDMMAYVDEYGNISSTPPDPTKVKSVKTDDIVIGVPRQLESKVASVRQGHVVFFNGSKGYGFIKDDDSGESIFVHNNDLTSPIKENDAVTFETQKGVKGLAAVRVKKI